MSDRYTKIEDRPGLVKDNTTGAILNTDISQLEMYRQRRKAMQAQTERLDNTEQRLDKVEQDLSEIKGLLHQIIGKLG